MPLETLSITKQKETRALELDGPQLLGQVRAEEQDYYTLTCTQSLNFRVFVKVLSGDADLFVSKTTPKPSVIDNSWFSVERGKFTSFLSFLSCSPVNDFISSVQVIARSKFHTSTLGLLP